MAEVHPTFYPETGTWEVERGPKARSLRSLLRVLPPGTRIRDYWPGGWVAPDSGPVTRADVPTAALRHPDEKPPGYVMRSDLRTNYRGQSAVAGRRRAAAKAVERAAEPPPPVGSKVVKKRVRGPKPLDVPQFLPRRKT